MARRVAVTLVVTLTCSCGGDDGGRSFRLPAGTEVDSGVPSDDVLVVVEAGNECSSRGPCADVEAGSACAVGLGNTRGLAVYRLGARGLLFDADGDGKPAAEQVIPTDDNPRRVVAHPSDPTVVYVATRERLQVFRLDAAGASRCLGETLRQTDVDPNAEVLDPIDLVIDPAIGDGIGLDGILYVASRGADRIDAYTIADDGTIPEVPSSCLVGADDDDFTAVDLINDGLVAVGGRNSLDVYRRENGQFPQATITPRPEATATPAPGATPTATPTPPGTPTPTPSPVPTCVGAIFINPAVSAISAAFVTDVEFAADPSADPNDPDATIGELLIGEELTNRLLTFPVEGDGRLEGDESSLTDRFGVYQRILRRERAGRSLVYSSLFREGRVDAFTFEDNRIAERPFSVTREDPGTLPVGLAIDGDDGSVLYVAQGGIDRVDGFLLDPDGTVLGDGLPATSTALGADRSPQPNDVVIIPLPLR